MGIILEKEDIHKSDKQSETVSPKKCRVGIISLYDYENNATRLIAATLRREGYYVAEIYFKDWKNNYFEPPTQRELDNLIKVFREQEITLAAISIRASAYLKLATQLTNLIRGKLGLPVIWGGVHVILCPEESIQIADMICMGEGEMTMVELARRMSKGESIDDTPNVWIRRGEEIIKNPTLDLIQDLDKIPFRDFEAKDKFVIRGGRISRRDPMFDDPIYLIMTSRGCPFHCAYCYNSTLRKIFKGKGKYFRFRSVDNVIEELKLAKKRKKNLKRIKFDDEVFNFYDDWVDEFVEKYKKEIGLPFECFTEPKLVKYDYFAKLKDAGLQIVYMGIQNSFRITEELYDRHTPEEVIKNAADVLHKLGLDARYQVILDDPMSNSQDKEALFKLLMDFERPFELYLFSLTVFPNTEVAHKLLDMGLITEDDIEGKNTKTFRQLRVDLSYPRDPESTYWAAMLVLLTKNFIPKKLLWKFYNNQKLRKNPGPLVWLAQVANFIKMGWVAGGMLIRGELTWYAARRWLNMDSLITQ